MNKEQILAFRDWAAVAQEQKKDGYVYLGKGSDPSLESIFGANKVHRDHGVSFDTAAGTYTFGDYWATTGIWERVTGLNFAQITNKQTMKTLPEKFYIYGINEEINAAIQKRLFELGIPWVGHKFTNNNLKAFAYTIANNFLTCYNEVVDKGRLKEWDNELSLKDLFDPELKLPKAPLILKEGEFLKDYSFKVAGDKIHVGCQAIPVARFLEVAKQVEEYVKA